MRPQSEQTKGRGPEALPLLLTLSSGVKGYTTIHAGSARQALTRLRFIAQLADTRSELPMTALNALVSEAIDLVVHATRVDGVPRVAEVIAVEHQQGGADATAFTTTQVFERDHAGRLIWSGQVPQRLADLFASSGVQIRDLLDGAPSDRRTGPGAP